MNIDDDKPEEDESGDDKKMPLLDHLVELRQRLIYSAIGLIVIFLGCFIIAGDLFNFLVQPLVNIWEANGEVEQRRLIITGLTEKFFTDIKIAFFAALFFSFPLISSQLWLFIAPGLYKNERNAFLPFLVATPILFFTGAAFVYYIVMPVAWGFFLEYSENPGGLLADYIGGGQQIRVELEARVAEYLALSMRLIFAFGISFELPVVITLLARVGLTTSTGLRQKRRYAVVLAFVAAAILTPPDPLSQISLALPIIFLYEISIISARLIERKRAVDSGIDDEDWDDDEDEDDDDAASGSPDDPGGDKNG